jgi:hypothetical protein
MNTTYCELCGTKEEQELTGRFSKESGEPLLRGRCPNLKCVRGCEDAGHEWSSWSGTWLTPNRKRKCGRCGDEEWSGYY